MALITISQVPNYRPHFKYTHPLLSLLGAFLTLAAMVYLNALFALITVLFVLALFVYITFSFKVSESRSESRSETRSALSLYLPSNCPLKASASL